MVRWQALAAVSLALQASPAFGQLPVLAYTGGGGNARDGSFQGNATFRVPPAAPPVVKNAPFSASQSTGSARTLADNAQVSRELALSQKTWRDSQGRVRIERPYLTGAAPLTNVPTLVEIFDPVAGSIYILDDVSCVAHRIAWNAAQSSQALPEDPSAVDLGTQSIEGLAIRGTRTTRMIAAGVEGNDSPLPVTQDTWYSPDLQINLRTVVSDPRAGTVTSNLANIDRHEPDPALFVAPPGYQTVDETGDFTIRWGVQ